SLEGHTNEVYDAVFSPDGRTLVTCSSDTSVRLWDVGTWRQTNVLRGHDGTARSAAFSPDSKRLATVGNHSHIVLWELPGCLRLRSGPSHNDDIARVAFLPEGRALAALGAHGSLTVWDPDTGTVRFDRKFLEFGSFAMGFSRDRPLAMAIS